MKYLKGLIVLYLFLFIIPVAFAEINIELPEKGFYNLGDKVNPTVSIKEIQNYDGFFSLHIFCDDYDLQYYTVPLSLEAGSRTQLTVPELSLSNSMMNKCRIKSIFEANDGDRINSVWSEYFFVTDRINVSIDKNLEAKPGEEIIISGEIKKNNNEILKNAEVKISFKGQEYNLNITRGQFQRTFRIAENIEAGEIPILVVATDKYGNYGDKISKIKIIPIPTRIENRLEIDVLNPGDNLNVMVILFDHTDNAINGSEINVKIFDPDDKIIAENNIQSMDKIEFKTEVSQIPGNYFLLSSFEDIKKQTSFMIESVKKIIMEQDGNFVNVENVGNVDYKDEITIILENEDKNYLINKKIELKPEEKIVIDLSKEVPQGTYDIILPSETTKIEDNIGTSIDETGETQEIVEQTKIIQDVTIEDNRPVIKKTADGFTSVTGAVVSAAGVVASKPILASIILVMIILGTITHYSWGFIKNKVRGKDKDESSHLFEDFKYEEKNEDNKR